MILLYNDDFNIRKIAQSGQCFRLNAVTEGYVLIARGHVLQLWNTPEGCAADCSQTEYETLWKGYFDLERDYAEIRRAADPEDLFLQRALSYGRGIRILRQDPWEMLVSFIISQRKNIPAIKACVETLCTRYGEPLESKGRRFYAFPSAERLAGLEERCFLECSLGYRAKYVHAAAQMVASGALDLNGIGSLPDGALMDALLGVSGVGEKVANCVVLFGYHRLSRFPRDVWINRIVEQEYGGEFPVMRYPDTAGVLQQYLFYYARSSEYSADRQETQRR